MIEPPGNSLAASQGNRVIESGDDLADDLQALLARITEEIAFNDAKGTAPYRLGMHDGLRFEIGQASPHLRRQALLALQEAQLHEHGGEDVVEIMRHAAGQLPDRFHFLRLDQLRLEPAALGDVASDALDGERLAVAVDE